MATNKFYAFLIPATGKTGISSSWPECEKKVKGVEGARYRGFKTRAEAEEWLRAGAGYEARVKPNLEPGIYFDAGTGRGHGVEISVTDEQGTDLLHTVLPKSKINRHGKHLISDAVTNNYGELLACKYALTFALKWDAKSVFGDSRLIIDYWSKGYAKKEDLAPETARLIHAVKKLRSQFEKKGGTLARISGDDNPADLGFHR